MQILHLGNKDVNSSSEAKMMYGWGIGVCFAPTKSIGNDGGES